MLLPKKISDSIFNDGATRVLRLSRPVSGRPENVLFTIKDLKDLRGRIRVWRVTGDQADSKKNETMTVEFASIENCIAAVEKLSHDPEHADWTPVFAKDACGDLVKESVSGRRLVHIAMY